MGPRERRARDWTEVQQKSATWCNATQQQERALHLALQTCCLHSRSAGLTQKPEVCALPGSCTAASTYPPVKQNLFQLLIMPLLYSLGTCLRQPERQW